jgi:glycosyltransferase involved in cell wall biosynthesis
MIDNNINILHVIDALNIGGAQELLALLADKTPKAAFKTIVCVIQPDVTLKSRIESKGVSVYCLGRPRPSIFRPLDIIAYSYRNIRDIISLCKQHQVDVVHCHLSDAEFLGILAGWIYGAQRIISTVHAPVLLPERQSGDIRNVLRIVATRLLYRLTNVVVAVSDDVAQQLKHVFHLSSGKIKIVMNGIDVESMHRIQPNPEILQSLSSLRGRKLILSVGRLMPPKGHECLINAMPHLIQRIDNVGLLLVGDGELKASLEQLSQELKVQEVICFLGNRSDIPDILASSDVFVMPSYSEGTSMALLEAMAASKPIVATDIPGNRAVIKHGHNGLLVPPGNPEKLADAIFFLLNHPQIAAEYGKNAYQDVFQHFNIDDTIAQLITIWK